MGIRSYVLTRIRVITLLFSISGAVLQSIVPESIRVIFRDELLGVRYKSRDEMVGSAFRRGNGPTPAPI